MCGGRSGAIWLPSLHPGGCCTLVVVEEIPSFYVKRFEYPEKRYINALNYYLLLMVLAIYGKATLVLSAISKFHFFSARYSSRSFCHRAMNEVSKRAENHEMGRPTP